MLTKLFQLLKRLKKEVGYFFLPPEIREEIFLGEEWEEEKRRSKQ